MKKRSSAGLIIIVLLVTAWPLWLNANQNWNNELYSEYSFEDYSTFEGASQKIDVKNIDFGLINAAIFFETNRQRHKHNVPVLKHHLQLEKVSQAHSQDMVKHDFFSHTSVVAGKEQLPDRLGKAGLRFQASGENLSMRFLLQLGEEPYYPPSSTGSFKRLDGSEIEMHTYVSFAAEVVNGWMNSPPHRENILDADYELLGCGSALFRIGNGIDAVPAMKLTQCFAK